MCRPLPIPRTEPAKPEVSAFLFKFFPKLSLTQALDLGQIFIQVHR